MMQIAARGAGVRDGGGLYANVAYEEVLRLVINCRK